LVLDAQQTPLDPVVAPSALASPPAPLAEQLAQIVLALHGPESKSPWDQMALQAVWKLALERSAKASTARWALPLLVLEGGQFSPASVV